MVLAFLSVIAVIVFLGMYLYEMKVNGNLVKENMRLHREQATWSNWVIDLAEKGEHDAFVEVGRVAAIQRNRRS